MQKQMKSSKKLTSSLPPLKPTRIWDVNTGEELTPAEHDTTLLGLLSYVREETRYLFEANRDKLFQDIGEAKGRLGSANSFGRQKGYVSRYKTNLPVRVKAKSRVNELVLHKLITETASYVNNPNPRKQPPSFSLKINLGAVDKQMVSMEANPTTQTITLVFKAWDREFLLEFDVPGYVFKRNISKWCLPTVQVEKGEVVYRFMIIETSAPTPVNSLKAGLDLGRHTLYTMSVVNQEGGLVAQYKTSGRLEQLNQKRERLLAEKKNILRKLDVYKQLNYSPVKQGVLLQEAARKRSKITRLGASIAAQLGGEVARKLAKHTPNALHLENLTWVTGKKYGSRWNHSKQQNAITHAVSRLGVKTRTVNPRNTSNTCHKCGNTITHNTKTRTIWCGDCKACLDRDLNASLNIAKNNTHPNQHSRIGGNPRVQTVEPQVTRGKSKLLPSGSYLQELQLE